jgi:hypothetical protein
MLAWLALDAGATEGTAEADRLREEMRTLARAGRWDGVDGVWTALLATGVPPTKESCQHAADAAQALGHLDDLMERLACAPDSEDNRARMAWIHEETGMVVLLASGNAAFAPESMPFRPDAARAVRNAIDALDAHGFYAGRLPTGPYTLGAAAITVERGPVLVARSGGETGRTDASPQLTAWHGMWGPVPLSMGEVGRVVRSEPAVAGTWRTGGILILAGAGVVVGGTGLIVGGAQVPLLQRALHPQLDDALIATGAVTAGAGLGGIAVGWVFRERAAERFSRPWDH